MRKYCKNIILLIIAALALTAVVPAAKAAQNEVNLIYFSDSYWTDNSLYTAIENVIYAKDSGITLERIEKQWTFVKNGTYILNPDRGVTPEEINAEEKYFISYGETDILETPDAVFLQHPSTEESLNEKILALKSPSLNITAAKAQQGIIDLPSGSTLDIITTAPKFAQSDWIPAASITYYLKINGSSIKATIILKPFGGIGGWKDALDKVSPKADPLVINTGNYSAYGNINLSTATLANYWAAMKVNVLAFSPSDFQLLWKFSYEQNTQILPVFLCSNYEVISGTAQPHIATQTVITKNNVNIGFISLMEPAAIDSAAGQNNIPVKSINPLNAATKAANNLKTDGKADFIVLISHLEQNTLNDLMPKLGFIDLVISADAIETTNRTINKITLNNWVNSRRPGPIAALYLNAYELGYTNLKFENIGGKLSVKAIEDLPSANFFADNTFSNNFYRINRRAIFRGTDESDNLLPPARLMFPSGVFSYQPLPFFNLTAEIVRKEAKTELAFTRIKDFNEPEFNDISAQTLNSWIGPNEKVIKGKLTGSQLKDLLKYADFSDAQDRSAKNYNEEFWLSPAGIEKDGSNYKVNGLRLTDGELYSVALPQSLTKERVLLPNLADRTAHFSVMDNDVALMVTNYLTKTRNKLDRQVFEDFSDYAKKRYKQEEKAKNSSDIAVSTQSYAAAYTQFSDNADRQYISALRAYMMNRPDVVGAWRFNLDRLSFQFSNTDITNSEYYAGFSNSRLNADSQTLIQGTLNFNAEYYTLKSRWVNTIYATYGKVILRPLNNPKIENESADKILLSSEYTHKNYEVKNLLGGFMAGPFAALEYETEFTKQDDANKLKILRGRGGIKLFDGKYIKDLSLAFTPEIDFTYSNDPDKYAWEISCRIEQPLREGLNIIYKGSFKDFIRTKSDSAFDLKYELELDARVSVKVWGNLSVEPFINYYQARAKSFDTVGRNLFVGISLNYSQLFKPFVSNL